MNWIKVTELPNTPKLINLDLVVKIERPDTHTDHSKLYFIDKSVMFVATDFDDWVFRLAKQIACGPA